MSETTIAILAVGTAIVIMLVVIALRLKPRSTAQEITKAFSEGVAALKDTTAEHVQIRDVLALIEQNEPLDKLAAYGDQLVGSALTYSIERLKDDLAVTQGQLSYNRRQAAHETDSMLRYYEGKVRNLETTEADLLRRLEEANFKLQEFKMMHAPATS
jgi:hypothetical protein